MATRRLKGERPCCQKVPMRLKALFLFLASAPMLLQGQSEKASPLEPELVYYNGQVVTVNSSFETAGAFAVAEERFVAVGTDQQVLSLAGPRTRKIDLKGKTVLPGFTDTHIHALHYAFGNNVNLDGVGSIAEMLKRIQAKARELPPKSWMVSLPLMSLDFVKERRMPTRFELDQAAPDHPVAINYHGHFIAVNSEALRQGEITAEKVDRLNQQTRHFGGMIMKDPARGEPNGWLVESAGGMGQISTMHLSAEQMMQAVQNISRDLNAAGITSVTNQITGSSAGDEFRILARMRREGLLTLRWRLNYSGVAGENPEQIAQSVRWLGPPSGFGDPWLRVGSIGELAFDGWWEPLDTAFLREPYDSPFTGQHERGALRYSRERLKQICMAAAQNDTQMSVHAAGDAALDLVLDVYEEVNAVHPISSKRWTIEHGGFSPSPRNLAQAVRLGVILSTQRSITYYNGATLKERLGEKRAGNIFPNKTWINAGVVVTGGADFPVSPFSPLLGIYASVTRKTVSGEILGGDERITREDAIRMYTFNPPKISFEESLKGSIETGKLADFVILSDNPLTVPEESIKEIQVLVTVVGGRTVYERPQP